MYTKNIYRGPAEPGEGLGVGPPIFFRPEVLCRQFGRLNVQTWRMVFRGPCVYSYSQLKKVNSAKLHILSVQSVLVFIIAYL